MKNVKERKSIVTNSMKSLRTKVLCLLIPLIIIGQLAISFVGIKNIDDFGNTVIKTDLNNGFNAALTSLDEYFWGIEYRMDTMSKTGIFQAGVQENEFTSSSRILDGLKGATDVIMSTVFRSGYINLSTPAIDYSSKGLSGVIPDDVYEKALKVDTLWVGPYEDKLSGNIALSIYKTVKNGDTPVGVIGMNINFSDISTYFSEREFSKTGYSLLLTSDGTVLSDKADMSRVHSKYDNNEVISISKTKGPLEGKIKINGSTYYYKADDVPRTDWKMISLINENEHKNVSQKITIIQIIIAVIILVISVIAVCIVINRIVERLRRLIKAMEGAGSGDLMSKVEVDESSDELSQIAKSYNKMLDDFSEIISDTKGAMESLTEKNEELNKSFEELKNSSNQISSTMQQIAAVSNEQARDTDLVVHETEDLSNAIENVSSSLLSMKSSCGKLEELSKLGLSTVNNLVVGSKNTMEATQEINNSVNNVSQSSKEIENIITLINEISEQTNLLALNAAIEAARVGENGRGFAVVADEIRKLAEQSQNATSNIQRIISGMQNKIKDTVDSIETVTGVITSQDDNVKETEKSFVDIFEGVISLNELVRNASELNNTMVEKKTNISNSMQSLAAGIEETSASTEEITSYTEEQLAVTNSVDELSVEIVELNENLVEKLNQFKEK
ncbi:methyl-accepting chemotaxis protein [Clostridium paraputrificum]|uniref:methyl-accepting chemotaxis protein n=1 Tax=Clostridium paraputrificum TaxID=29363 RepID=UPI003D34D285